MAYQVLARKWRPKTFADLVGQEHVVKALQNAIEKGRLHHAYLLTGTRGVGKTTIARILAKSLNCENLHQGEPCGICSACSQIDSGRFVDLLEIDAASNTGIDNIREVLENAQYAPTAGKYKVYIIDEVHMLSKSAFNAMLKTLEEPPEHVKFILATTDPHKVPVTVLSRCLQFVLRNMTAQQVADHLAYVLNEEKISFENNALQLLGRAAAGSMRDALSLLDQAIALGSGKVSEQDVRQMIGAVDKRYLYELLQFIAEQNGVALIEKAQEMAARAIGFDNALSELALLLQQLALLQTIPNALTGHPEEMILQTLAQQLSGEQIQLYYQCAIHGKQDLSLAPDEYAGFVMTLLRMLAFAPMAAKAQPANAQIHGSELHNPKPLMPSETIQSIEKPAKDYSDGIEKANIPSENMIQIEQQVSANMPSETTQSIEKTTKNFSDGMKDSIMPSENDIPPWQEIANNMPSETIQLVDKSEKNLSDGIREPAKLSEISIIEQAEDDDGHDTLFEPNTNHVMPSELNEDDEEDEIAEVFTPLPEFMRENWVAIVKRLASKLGAAQMLANFCAWADYDESNQTLFLAMNGHSSINTKKEYFDKIRQVLAETYQINGLRLQTCDWQDNQQWETPTMQRVRLQEEGRQQAQQLLENDEACQQIMQAFNSHEWKKETLELLQNQEDK